MDRKCESHEVHEERFKHIDEALGKADTARENMCTQINAKASARMVTWAIGILVTVMLFLATYTTSTVSTMQKMVYKVEAKQELLVEKVDLMIEVVSASNER